MKMKNDKRFLTVCSEGNIFTTDKTIYADRETGIQYLYMQSLYAGGGLTPLLDKDGKPMILSAEEIEKLKDKD